MNVFTNEYFLEEISTAIRDYLQDIRVASQSSPEKTEMLMECRYDEKYLFEILISLKKKKKIADVSGSLSWDENHFCLQDGWIVLIMFVRSFTSLSAVNMIDGSRQCTVFELTVMSRRLFWRDYHSIWLFECRGRADNALDMTKNISRENVDFG